MKKDDRITLAAAAKLVDGASPRAVQYWASRGLNGIKLPTFKDVRGRVFTTRAALEEFILSVNREWTPKE